MLFWLVLAAPFTIIGVVFTAIGFVQGQYVFSAIGAGALAVGLAAIGVAIAMSRRAKRILQTGRRVRARVVAIERNYSLKFNDNPAWRIAVEWRDPLTGKTCSGLGENMFFDPQPWLGPEIDVFVDEANPDAFVVDVRPIRAARSGRGSGAVGA